VDYSVFFRDNIKSEVCNINNTVENDFFGFPKVKCLDLTGEVDKSVRFSLEIFSGFNVPKIIKIG